MANLEHLDILKQGVEIWNQWREEHRSKPELELDFSHLKTDNRKYAHIVAAHLNVQFKPDLSLAHLEGANLARANFSNTHLLGSHLDGANLMNADLGGAYLGGAYLNHANLEGASLIQSHLVVADLAGVNFTEANLKEAFFNGNDLKEADLSAATLWQTTFGAVDLHLAKGLETVKHRGPSFIDIQTIVLSQGNIPEIFLREAGIPESFITYARALINNPIEYYTCFISYSSKDQGFAERIYADLQSHGVRCWFAPEDLKIGDHYHQRIDESIRLYDKLVLILSEHAVQSAWVEREVVAAREKEDHLGYEILFPIRLDETVMNTTKAWAADVRRRWHIGDFTHWKQYESYQQTFERLLRDLKAEYKPKG